ncbi:DNA translocase FtsK, partial [Candidatus Rickettsia tasmanensis]
IELPNKQREFFCLKELIETPEYQDKSTLLPLVLGKDLAGKPLIADLAKMPHLLVAGTTDKINITSSYQKPVSEKVKFPEEARSVPANLIKFFSKPVSPKISQSEIAELPPISLLRDPENHHVKGASSSELKQKAEELLTVLNDFGVKGQIININQGPVVTQYEFEPAAGTKTSRVVGLSDDIARSLSALSTRIAVIPGKNVLGIELPNKQREFFCLKELIETPEYQDKSTLLPLVLGKDLAGKPLIADLAKMPHLLVAGTT